MIIDRLLRYMPTVNLLPVALRAEGRASRGEYGLTILGVSLSNLCITFILLAGQRHLMPFVGIASIFILWAFLAIIVRRSHDIGVSGWILGPTMVVWLLACDILLAPGTALFWYGGYLRTIPLVMLGFAAGDLQANKFGQPRYNRAKF